MCEKVHISFKLSHIYFLYNAALRAKIPLTFNFFVDFARTRMRSMRFAA